MARGNEIAFVCGRKGSGKSQWLNDTYVRRMPRVIHHDPNGELLQDKRVYLASSWSQLLEVLHVVADGERFPRWQVAAAFDDVPSLVRLFRLLAPSDDFGRNSLSRLLGGVALVSGECDLIAPNGTTRPEIKSGWKRGRHHELSLLMGTQRPAECDRIVTSQADVTAVFQLEESRDLDFVERRLGKFAAEEVAQLGPYWHVEARSGDGAFSVVDASRRVVRRRRRLDGLVISRGA